MLAQSALQPLNARDGLVQSTLLLAEKSLLFSDGRVLSLDDACKNRSDVHRGDALPILRGHEVRDVLGDRTQLLLVRGCLVGEMHRPQGCQSLRRLLFRQRADILFDGPRAIVRQIPRYCACGHDVAGEDVAVDVQALCRCRGPDTHVAIDIRGFVLDPAQNS